MGAVPDEKFRPPNWEGRPTCHVGARAKMSRESSGELNGEATAVGTGGLEMELNSPMERVCGARVVP